MSRIPVAAALAVAAMLAACGGTSGPESTGDQPTGAPPAAGMCLEGAEDCLDTPVEGDADDDPGAQIDDAAAIRDAESLLGEAEDDVLEAWADVRVGRHGDEQMMLTEDHRPGRKTIATEDDGTGTYRVVEVVVETGDGTVTVSDGVED